MRVFVTGATGFIGAAIVRELLDAGHGVLGLTRSEAGAKALTSAGAQAHWGDLENLESLRDGAAATDAVIHTAFNHDFSQFAASCEADRRAITVLGTALAGSGRGFIVTSPLGMAVGRPATEADPPMPTSEQYPRASEKTAAAFEGQGVGVMVVRLPQVHDPVKQGLVSLAVEIARDTGESAYVGTGLNRWAAVHRLDAARLYRLALERGKPGARYQGVAEDGVAVREIAEAIGRSLKVPVVSKTVPEAEAHFGFLARFMGRDLTGSSLETQRQLGWHPSGPGLISDLNRLS